MTVTYHYRREKRTSFQKIRSETITQEVKSHIYYFGFFRNSGRTLFFHDQEETMLTFIMFILNIAIAYLVGSLSSAIIVCRLFHFPDPRTQGSNNPGATNVLRIAGKKYAAIVLLGDMLKGFLPVLLASLLGANLMTLGFTCFAAVFGHMYPIFFQFKGGKGVATALGAFLGLQFIMGVVLIGTWLVIANFSRYSSLASIVTITFAPFYFLYGFATMQLFTPLAIISIFVLYQHRDNISRLIVGEEPKISFKKKK